MIGRVLSHYEIVAQIGAGGMGVVYRARDTSLGREVALKVLPAELALDPQRLSRFEREATTLAALDHPNIVTIFSVEQAEGIHFLTMQLVQGHTLAELIPARGMPLSQSLPIAIGIANALAAAHDRGIVHRDLKPGNVMVTADGQVKILDFGLAKLRQETSEEGEATTVGAGEMTARGVILGTTAYMSPEQAEGRPVDQRSDLFSLGVVLYEMATGRRPFQGDTPVALISSIIKDAPPPPSDVNPVVPEALSRVITRCLAKQLDRRYQSALDLRNDLEDLTLQGAAGARPAPAAARGRRVARAAILLAIACVGAVGAWLLWRGGLLRQGAGAPRAQFAQLTALPGVEQFPSLSPDGQWVVYAGLGAGGSDIYLQSTTGETPINLTEQSAADDDQPAFSPDGQRIAFRSDREGGGIFVMGRTGEAVRRVTRAGFNPSWSPDGTTLVYATERVGLMPLNWEGVSELWVVPVEGGEPRRLSAGDAVQPRWSPSGTRIAFQTRLGTAAQMDIMTIPVAGGEAVPVVSDPATDWSPAWSPDGRFIYFVSDRGGSMNLWRVAIDEASGRPHGEPEPVTTPAAFTAHPSLAADGCRIAFSSVLMRQNLQVAGFDPERLVVAEPTWVTSGSRQWSSPDLSPDGEWVVFYSRDLPEGDLYVARADGGGLRQVTGGPELDRVPRWSPDGERIAYFSNRSGQIQLWLVRADGSDRRQVSEGTGASLAAWSPDAARLAVNSLWGREGIQPNFIVDPDRPRERRELPPTEDALGRFVLNSWSPDGRWLAGMINYSDQGIVTFAFDSGTYERLTSFGQWPVWLPDSRHLLFVSGGTAFFVVDSATRDVRKVYSAARDVLGPPRLSRDGRRVVFSRRTTEADIWLLTLQ